jgi:hypothetical protein
MSLLYQYLCHRGSLEVKRNMYLKGNVLPFFRQKFRKFKMCESIIEFLDPIYKDCSDF